jgi:thioredoxin reductase (NADPH)
MRTVLIEQGAPGGQVINSEAVENYPGFVSVNGFELSQKFVEHAQSYNLEMLSQQVIELEPGLEYHSVRLDSGETLKTHAVILATGGAPRKLNIPGEDELYGKGVSYCAVCDGFFFRTKKVVVVGGGDTAAEEALYLSKLTPRVSLVHRRDSLRASSITVVTAIKADGDSVCAVDVQDVNTGANKSLVTDGVFIFIGFKPKNELVPAGTKLNADGYVITDEKCETNVPGLFAIGDLRERYARQVVLSAADGCLAALAAAHWVETRRASEN